MEEENNNNNNNLENTLEAHSPFLRALIANTGEVIIELTREIYERSVD